MQNLDVLASLEAKSRTTTVDELAKGGRRNVRVIRAADVALMIQESVERAIEVSGLVSPEAIEEVKRQANVEFESLKTERAAEQSRIASIEDRNGELEAALATKMTELTRVQDELEARESEIEEARSRLGEALASQCDTEELSALRSQNETIGTECEELRAELEALRRETEASLDHEDQLRLKDEAIREMHDMHRKELARLQESEIERQASEERIIEAERQTEELRDRVRELETALEAQAAQAAAPAQAQAAPAAPDQTQALLMMRLMDEIQNLKQGQVPAQAAAAQPQPAAAPASTQAAAPAADTSALESKLAQIVGSLDSKIEQMGKKMGVSTAVESEVDFNSLVSRAVEDSDNLESNVDNLDVEKRQGTGIAANLARIKKLKGGG